MKTRQSSRFLQTLLCTITVSLVTSADIVQQFHDNVHLGAFNHLTINKNTGKLYLGAVNRLYQLSSDLTGDLSIKTGPKLDNPDCPMNSCDGEKTLRDSYNKLLLVDYQNRKLITCTSLFHGLCEKRKLEDITQTDRQFDLPMVANDATSSTVGFIATGAVLQPGAPPKNALYISVTWTNVGMEGYRALVPAFCVRNLTDFKIYYKGMGVWSKIEVESTQRNSFRIRYVHGFSSGGFSYMLSVQPIKPMSTDYVSKIFRVCQNDKKFYSYTELQLTCKHGGVDFNILQAATVEKPGSLLAKSLGISTTEDVLFAVFSVSLASKDKESYPSGMSALCIYSLKYIQSKFRENIVECFNGNGKLGPEHFMSTKSCVNSQINVPEPYCGQHNINTPLAGSIPLEKNAVLGFKGQTPLASIAVTTTHKYTVAFVGLMDGKLRKVSIKDVDQKNGQYPGVDEFDSLVVDEGSAVNADMPFDLDAKHLYVMTERKTTFAVVGLHLSWIPRSTAKAKSVTF